MTLSHNKKETIFTIAAVVSDIVQVVSALLQAYGLYYIIHHMK